MPRRDDRGTGLVASVAGVLVFLALVTFAAQLLISLYARTVVTAVAFDAARSVATGTDGRGDAETSDTTRAERTARALLGPTGNRASFSWTIDPDAVELRVRAPVPRLALLPVSLGGLTEVDRTVTVRTERLR